MSGAATQVAETARAQAIGGEMAARAAQGLRSLTPAVNEVARGVGNAASGLANAAAGGIESALAAGRLNAPVPAPAPAPVAAAPAPAPAPVAAAPAPAPAPAEEGGFFSSVTNFVSDTAQAVGGAVVDTAQTVGGAVVDTAQTVGGAVVDTAQTVGGAVVDTAQTVGGAVVDTAQAVGGAVVDTAQVVGGAVADTARSVGGAVADTARSVGGAVADTARSVGGAVADTARSVGGAVADTARSVGGAVADTARSVGGAVADTAQTVGGAVAEGAQAAGGLANELADKYLNQLDVKSRVGELGVGDTWTAGGSVDVDGRVAQVGVDGDVAVTRTDKGYVVSVDGQVAAGVGVSAEGMGGAGASANAQLQAGARVEFTYATPEEATQAARAFMGPTGMASSIISGDGVSGATVDPRSLMDHMSAVEFSGGAAAGMAADVGYPGMSAEASGNAEAEVKVRIERDPSQPNKPAELVVQESYSVNYAAEAKAGSENYGPNASAAAGFQGKVTAEQRMVLPPDVTPGSALADPTGTTARLTGQFLNDPRSTMSVTLQTQTTANAQVNGEAPPDTAHTIKLTGNPRQVLDSGALDQALHGDFLGAARTLAPITSAEAKTETVDTEDQTYVDYGGVNAEASTTDREVVARQGDTRDANGRVTDRYTGEELLRDILSGQVEVV
ncbi:hypothetical protein [Melittangium boletus]|uniref:hypothetical protein n=1 Tax=Melittangium boletus TaxID=83453 RepID=UPI003DA5CA28